MALEVVVVAAFDVVHPGVKVLAGDACVITTGKTGEEEEGHTKSEEQGKKSERVAACRAI